MTTLTRAILAAGAILGVALGLVLPAPHMQARGHHLITPGASSE